MSKKPKKPKKRTYKIALPTDRLGTPIHVGDWLWFEDGNEMMRVESLTYDGMMWFAGDEHDDCASDNLGAGIVIGARRGNHD